MRMDGFKALEIFKNIDSLEYTDEEKGLATYRILFVTPDHRVTKKEIIEVAKYLHNLCYTFKSEENDEHI